jgi:hypothetical protein
MRRIIVKVTCDDTGRGSAAVHQYISHTVCQALWQFFTDDRCGALCEGFVYKQVTICMYAFDSNKGVSLTNGPGVDAQ